jgi:hypothetical protein
MEHGVSDHPVPEKTLPQWVTPGTSFKEVYGNENDCVWHVRGIVDGRAVCRRWRATKQRWHYEVLDWIWFDAFKEHLRPKQ